MPWEAQRMTNGSCTTGCDIDREMPRDQLFVNAAATSTFLIQSPVQLHTMTRCPGLNLYHVCGIHATCNTQQQLRTWPIPPIVVCDVVHPAGYHIRDSEGTAIVEWGASPAADLQQQQPAAATQAVSMLVCQQVCVHSVCNASFEHMVTAQQQA